jgi:DNA-binding transcriptional LysR family regulator
MDLSTGTLATIRVVAERGSFTAAAAALGYTQSAVSRQVAAAEREFGTTLFDRVRGGVRLTRTGRRRTPSTPPRRPVASGWAPSLRRARRSYPARWRR